MMTAEVVVRWIDGTGDLRVSDHSELELSREAPWRWVDVGHVDEKTLVLLGDEFALHPLLVEDAIHRQHRPKFDSFPDGAYIAWLFPSDTVAGDTDLDELDAFIGKNYLITVHEGDLGVIAEVAQEAQSTRSLGTDWILHAIIDRLVDSVLPRVDAVGDRLDDVEDRLLAGPRTDDLRDLYSIRRQLVRLHRVIAPERDILRGLARERNLVSEEAYRYFQDVADHLARVEDSIETYRDVAAAAMDIYLSAQSNRMNEIMKQLTVVATIFMPLTLMSGIYGMNVLKGMWPPVTAHWSFGAIVGAMIAIALWMSLYFRRKKWW